MGGLGIFLLGMKYMSEGMQAVAGNSLRRMIGAVTNNRLLALGVGTFVTTLVQSSSVTTVMVVGFVNSGVMTLSQAIGVIMGANNMDPITTAGEFCINPSEAIAAANANIEMKSILNREPCRKS